MHGISPTLGERFQSDKRSILEIEFELFPDRQGGMTTQEIQQYVDAAITANFENFTSESDEMMTSEGGDGRFLGKVYATRYAGLPVASYIFLAIGETDKKVQIVKLGNVECLQPGESDLDMLLEKELGVKKSES
ncbi:hypothetical protein JIN77_09525 [Verrucomicrobiaceae bacterium R5-34]|nr:hypothetical protein [Verrucomicrobiaceae bacterium R5-34]